MPDRSADAPAPDRSGASFRVPIGAARSSGDAYDLPLTAGIVTTVGVFVVLLNIGADVAGAWVDPRTRERATKGLIPLPAAVVQSWRDPAYGAASRSGWRSCCSRSSRSRSASAARGRGTAASSGRFARCK